MEINLKKSKTYPPDLKKDSDYSVLRQWCVTICDFLLSINSEFSNLVYGKYGVMEVIGNIDKTHNLRKMSKWMT